MIFGQIILCLPQKKCRTHHHTDKQAFPYTLFLTSRVALNHKSSDNTQLNIMALRFLGLRKELSMKEIQDEMKAVYRTCDDNAVECAEIKKRIHKIGLLKNAVKPEVLDALQDGGFVTLRELISGMKQAMTGDETIELSDSALATVRNAFFHCASCEVNRVEFVKRLTEAEVEVSGETVPLFQHPEHARPETPTFMMHPLFGVFPSAGTADGSPMFLPDHLTWPQVKKLWSEFDRKFSHKLQKMRKIFVSLQSHIFDTLSSSRKQELLQIQREIAEAQQTAELLRRAEVAKAAQDAHGDAPVPAQTFLPLKKIGKDQIKARAIATIRVPMGMLYTELQNTKTFPKDDEIYKTSFLEDWCRERDIYDNLRREYEQRLAEQRKARSHVTWPEPRAPLVLSWDDIMKQMLILMPVVPLRNEVTQPSVNSRDHSRNTSVAFLTEHDPSDLSFSPFNASSGNHAAHRRLISVARERASIVVEGDESETPAATVDQDAPQTVDGKTLHRLRTQESLLHHLLHSLMEHEELNALDQKTEAILKHVWEVMERLYADVVLDMEDVAHATVHAIENLRDNVAAAAAHLPKPPTFRITDDDRYRLTPKGVKVSRTMHPRQYIPNLTELKDRALAHLHIRK